MGTKYTTQSTSGYNASPPPDDGTQVASNLVTWAGVKTKLADVLKTFGEAINTALVSALDLSARAISTPDTAVATDHWKTLQVTGNTTITLSSAASMGAGYEVGICNAGVGVVTVTPGAAADTINGVSASVTVSIKGTKIFRTNQALTGYNVVGGYDPQTVTASTSVVTPLWDTGASALGQIKVNGTTVLNINTAQVVPTADLGANLGSAANRYAAVFTPIIDSGTTGSGALKTNNGTTVLTWANDLSVKPVGLLDLTTGTAGQISFPAAQNASAGANVLDDYEEGTWTPVVGGNATYTTQEATYTKIGRLVFIRGILVINVLGTGSTSVISGLPFTSATTTGTTSLTISPTSGLAIGVVSIAGSIGSNATSFTLNGRTVSANADAAVAVLGNGASVTFSGCYHV